MKSKRIGSSLLLMLTAFIWGTAFVAQSVGMDYVGPFTFNAVRFVIGGIVLIPCIFIIKAVNKDVNIDYNHSDRRKNGITGGIFCGIILCISSSFQQIGIIYTSVGKAGFITALYIIIVPLLGVFMGRKVSLLVKISVFFAVTGMYLLCVKEGISVNKGDIYIFLCAVGFSFHILVIDYYTSKADGVFMSCIQFFTAGLLASIIMILFEKPEIYTILTAWKPILYAGVMSCGVAYTLQIIGQKNTQPAIACLILSLESVFSALAGWIILDQKLSKREILGCIMVFAAILLAQYKPEDK